MDLLMVVARTEVAADQLYRFLDSCVHTGFPWGPLKIVGGVFCSGSIVSAVVSHDQKSGRSIADPDVAEAIVFLRCDGTNEAMQRLYRIVSLI